jgi:hypothetical protein
LNLEFSQCKFPGVEEEVLSGSVSQKEPIGTVLEQQVEAHLGSAVLAVETFLAVFIGLLDGFDGVEGATDGTSCSVEGSGGPIIEDATVHGRQELSVFAQINAQGSDGGVASDHPMEDVLQDLGFLWMHGVVLSGELPSLEDVLEAQGVDVPI